jgi:hypothetical protein
MAASERSTKPTVRERFRDWRRHRRQRAAERAMTKPDVEGYAEGALYRQGGERGRAGHRKF